MVAGLLECSLATSHDIHVVTGLGLDLDGEATSNSSMSPLPDSTNMLACKLVPVNRLCIDNLGHAIVQRGHKRSLLFHLNSTYHFTIQSLEGVKIARTVMAAAVFT
jgi:hypothetical protein